MDADAEGEEAAAAGGEMDMIIMGATEVEGIEETPGQPRLPATNGSGLQSKAVSLC